METIKIAIKNKKPMTQVGRPKKYALGPFCKNKGNSPIEKYPEKITPANEEKNSDFDKDSTFHLLKNRSKEKISNKQNIINPK
ncbi:MAG TPA: hypothetical protein P5548_03060 [Candidatus Moranbacteria bacterium]|nr:hypothetical protein [Candidatus Moranbacteria bacterium]HRZ33848.1 hypothetical protein [Candidatus Moranbacteria bacterium]